MDSSKKLLEKDPKYDKIKKQGEKVVCTQELSFNWMVVK